MSKILFTANTYFQLITAVRMKLTIKKDDECSIVISQHSRNADKVADNLRKCNLFNQVYYIDASGYEYNANSTRTDFMKLNILEIFGKDLKVGNNYDELICFNEGQMEHIIFAYLSKHNPKIIRNVIEEGMLSYTVSHDQHTDGRYNKIYNLRNKLGRKNIADDIEYFYCYSPSAYKGPYKTYQIPKIEDTDIEFKRIIKSIFFPDKEIKPYTYKYIYFGTGIVLDTGVDIGEKDMLRRLRDLVGNENLVLKVHPRDNIESYRQEGFNIDENSSIPWEAIQLNGDFTKNVLLSSLSSSIMSLNACLDNPPRAHFLFKECDVEKTELSNRLSKDITNLLNNKELGYKNISVVDSLKDIL